MASGTLTDYAKRGENEKQATDRLLNALLALGGEQVADDDLIFEGRKLIIPETMTPRAAIKFLQKHIEQEEEETSFQRTFKYRPHDVAMALQVGLKEAFGTTGIAKAQQTMFGKIPPPVVTIDIGVDKQAQVPFGQMEFPPVEGRIIVGAVRDEEFGMLGQIQIVAPRKYRAHIEGIWKVIQNVLETRSIYRGKCINGAESPGFFDPYTVDKRKVVYSDEVYAQLRANIWSLIEHTDVNQNLGISLKRAVLLEGPYGTGKSLAAMLTAQITDQHGWTFIQCRPGRDDLEKVMQTARLYEPAVVFYEDVDTLAKEGEPEKISALLDLFDGITAKGTRLVVVLTTNHAETIHKGMVRPGRLDAVIHIAALDLPGIENLIKATVPEALLDPSLDFTQIGKSMEGFLPAFIKEAIERAVRYMIARTDGHPDVLTTDDFVQSADGLKPQLDLMNNAGEGSPPEPVGVAIKRAMREAMTGVQIVDSDGDALYEAIYSDKRETIIPEHARN